MALDRKKLNEIAVSRSDRAKRLAHERSVNREWLRMSQDIALTLLYYMKKAGINQKELAEKMNVSPAYVGKLLKGCENLTLETICKVQRAIDESLVSVVRPYHIYCVTSIAQPGTYQIAENTVNSETYSDVCIENNHTFTIAQREIA